MIEHLFSGLILGAGCSIAPGPLMLLTMTATMRSGWKEGLKVSLAPVVSDFVIIALCFAFHVFLDEFELFLICVRYVGCIFLAYMGFSLVFGKSGNLTLQDEKKGSFFKQGCLCNLLNPYPYVFWLSVGIPLLLGAYEEVGVFGDVLCFIGFYVAFVVVKAVIIYFTHAGNSLAKSQVKIKAERFMGFLLFLMAANLFLEALSS